METKTETRMANASAVAKAFGRPVSTLYGHMKNLGITGVRKHGDGRTKGNPILLTQDEVDLLAESLKNARKYKNRHSQPPAPVASQSAPPKPNGSPTWLEFQACARKMAQLCKHFRVSLLEIETSEGKQKVRYEQNNAGEIDL